MRRSDVAGVVLGVVGTTVGLVLLGGGLYGSEPLGVPRTPAAVGLTALQMLGGGAALGGVLLAGRRVSPWAPLVSALLWAAGSVAVLADPTILAGAGFDAAATVFGHQVGLGLSALMLLGAFALKPTGARVVAPVGARVPAQVGRAPEQRDTDPALPPVTAFRNGPRRPTGPGPRHRAAPRWSPPAPPRMANPRRRPG